MRKIDPVYVPEDKLWYADVGDVEVNAPSLREMTMIVRQMNIGSFKIVGYEPHGVGHQINYREARNTEPVRNSSGIMMRKRREDAMKISGEAAEVGGARPRGKTKIYDHDAILDLWKAGLSAAAIGESLSMSAEMVGSIVSKSRRAGDDRAVYRNNWGGRIK